MEFVCVLMNMGMIVVPGAFNVVQLSCPPVFRACHSHGIVKRAEEETRFHFGQLARRSVPLLLFDVRRIVSYLASSSSVALLFSSDHHDGSLLRSRQTIALYTSLHRCNLNASKLFVHLWFDVWERSEDLLDVRALISVVCYNELYFSHIKF